ncbi:MAG TPA: rhodanese-like domain-containing protein, partial [Anaerolineaceae bacterium]|nr:rhodanese-like domain-containing protein [Anaerolineaceae bacterium]
SEYLCLIDVRDPVEQQVSRLPRAIVIPWDRVLDRVKEMDRETEMVLYCRSGERSARAVRQLVQAGFRQVKNLRGGINAYAEQVDPEMKRY